jgi:hypothetical protein
VVVVKLLSEFRGIDIDAAIISTVYIKEGPYTLDLLIVYPYEKPKTIISGIYTQEKYTGAENSYIIAAK